MGKSCATAPTNKKDYIYDLGKILIKENGKKKYYSPKQVKKAHEKSKWYEGLDFSCWAMCIFSSHTDFDKHHQMTGEICDYSEMKSEMISGLTATSAINLTDIPDKDIDSSWLDFGDIFEGIGEFIGGIFDGF